MAYLSLNGTVVREEDAMVPATDRGFLFGDGAFTTLRVEEGTPLDLSLHLQRLEKSCQQLNINYPAIDSETVQDLIHANSAHTGLWRLKILISASDSGHLDLRPRPHSTVLLTLKPYSPPAGFLRVGFYPYMGMGLKMKTLAYLGRLYLKEQARLQGLDDLITLDTNGYILQASSANVFWIHNDEFWTPSPDLDLLYGITIAQLVDEYRKQGYRVYHGKYRPEAIPKAAQLYLCNSLMQAISIDLC